MDFFNWSVELLMSSSDARQDTSTASLLSRSLSIYKDLHVWARASLLSLSLSLSLFRVFRLFALVAICDRQKWRESHGDNCKSDKVFVFTIHTVHGPQTTASYRRPSSITTQPFFHYASYHNPAVAKGGSTWAQFARDRNRDKWKSWLKLAYLCAMYLPLCLPPRHIFVQIC